MPETKEGPERIWMGGKGWPHVRFACLPAEGETEYIRKDVADAAVEQARREVWEKAIAVAKDKTWWGDKDNPKYLNGVVAALEAAAKEK